MVAQLAAERELQKEVSETVCPPPEARSSFSLCAHPERDELLLYGGEYYNGKQVSAVTVTGQPGSPPLRHTSREERAQLLAVYFEVNTSCRCLKAGHCYM